MRMRFGTPIINIDPLNPLRGPLKIAFQTKTSELFAGKAEGQNGPEAMLFTVEDAFWPDNVASGERSRLQSK